MLRLSSFALKHRPLITRLVIVCLLAWTAFRPAPQPLAAQGTPTFGAVTISLDYTANGFKPIESGDIFPAGIEAVVATVCTTDMPAGKTIAVQWFADGTPEGDISEVTTAGNDCLASPLINAGGLKAATWEVRYSMDGAVMTTRTFALAPTPGVYGLKFGDDVAILERTIIGERSQFPAGTRFVGVVYRYVNLPEAPKVVGQWQYNGQVDHEFPIDLVAGNGFSYLALSNDNGIPPGLWELRISVNDQLVKTGSIIVG
jgi:hypothetical protein